MKSIVPLICLCTLVSSGNNTSDDYVEDTQHAICKIITQDIQTYANATVKRQLKGVCTARTMNAKFKQLESKILRELADIKALVSRPHSPLVKAPSYDYYDENVVPKSLNDFDDIVSVSETFTQNSDYERTEVSKFNGTIYTKKGERVYSYYWEIEDISAVRQAGGHLQSPSFVVLDHRLCLEMFANYLTPDYLGLQLWTRSNIMRKYRLTILEQLDVGKDIISQLFDSTSSGEIYSVPYAKLEERSYLYKNRIIIKVTIYLDS